MPSWLDDAPDAPPPAASPPGPAPVAAQASWLDQAPDAPAPEPSPQEPASAPVVDLLKYRATTTPVAPERAAEALKYAAATGGDPQWVLDNLDAVKKEVDASQVPWQKLWDDHPALRPFLGEPVAAQVIKDESTRLPVLMKWLGGWWMDDGGKLTTPFAEGSHYVWDAKLASIGQGIDEVRLAARKAADANSVMRDFLEPWLNIGTGKTYSPPKVFAAENAAAKHELEKSVSRDFDTNVAGRVALAPFRMAPSLAGAVAVGAVATAAAPAEVAVGAGLGARALWWAFQGYGSLYEGLGKIEGAAGEKVDETSKQVISALGSLAAGFAMEFGLRPISKVFGEAALTNAAKVTGETAIANPTLVQTFGRIAREGGHALASGAAAMASQSAINEGAMQLGRGRAGMEPDAGAVVRASVDGFTSSIPDLLVLSFFGPARAEMKRRGEVVRAETSAQVLLKQGEAVRASKLRDRFSSGLEQIIRAGAGETGQDTIYATTERFDQVAKAKGADPRSMAAAIIGDDGAAWDRAKQTGLALEIPIEKYLTRLAVNPELERALLPDLRVDKDGRTLREVGEQQAKDRELMARVMAEPAPADDIAFDAVKKDFTQKAVASGKVTPDLAAANAENVARVYRYAELRDRPRALAAGEKPWTAWDFYTQLAPIEIAGWKDANRQVTSSGTEPARAPGALSPSSGRSALLEQALSGNADAIRSLDQIAWTDPLTGLGSMRAYLDFLTTQPARGGVHILVDLPGLGQVNNRFGQPVGNAYLSDTARALHEASRAQDGKAYRGGGDEFTFHFDTPAAAEAFLAKGRELVAALPEVAPGVKRSFYAGVGTSEASAAGELNKAKKEAKAKHGDSKVNPQAIGHGEFFESRDLAGFKPVEGSDVLVANLDGAAVTVDRAAQESLKQGPERLSASKDRGSVVFTPLEGGKGIKASIDLFQNADPSTLAHETAHVFGRLLELLATREGATEEVRADYAQMLKAMGYATPEERVAAREERLALQGQVTPAGSAEHQQVTKRLTELGAKEERLSYLWEQYLSEGKAPEAALAGTLGRFKNWLVKVYRSVTELRQTYTTQYGQELGPLNPATKALFDRLLTAETEVSRAAGGAGLEALPGSGPEVKQAFAEARAEAEQKLLKAIVEGDRKANSEMMQQERARLRDELAPQVDADPAQAAVKALQAGGTDILKGPGGEAVKLNRKALTKAHGAEFTRSLAKEHPGIFGPKGEGMKADDVAALLGFENGEDLVRRLSGTRNRDALLEDRVQQAMIDLYGPPLVQDPAALAERAFEAAATPKAAGAIIKEMSRLAADLGDPGMDVRSRGVSWTAMVTAAETMVTGGRVADLSPGKYEASMKAAGRRAFEAMQKGAEAKGETGRKKAIQRAYEERDQQLWAMAMGRAAETQKAELDQRKAQIEKTGRTAWRSELGKADPVFVDAHDTLLSAIGLGDVPADPTGKRGGLEQALAKAVADAADLNFDPQVIRQVIASQTKWRDLTVAQAWEVSNAVQNLRTIANNANEMTVLGKRVARAQVIDEMVAAAERLPAQPKFEDDPRIADTVGRAIRLGGQHIDALLLDVASVAHILDGGNRDGVFHRIFIDNRLAAREKRNELTRSFLVSLTKAFEKSGLDRGRLYERIRVGSELPLNEQLSRFRTGEQRTRANLIMMALNLGNDSNAERFLGGYGWQRDQVLGVLQKHLNAKEWRWVQSVWDALEGKGGGPALYEEMARVHQEETGLPPEKIQPTPFKVTTREGEVVELQGGYFPARYDPRPGSEKKTGEKQLQDSISAFFSEGYQTGGMKPYSPHAKARAEHFNDLVNLDWGIVPQHVSQVIQDIAYRGYAKQTAALVLDPRFQNLMAERLGEERAKFFAPWLRSVVNSTSDSVPSDLRLSDRVMGNLKGKAAIASIGWSIPVALGDLTNPLTAVASGDIKARYLALVTAKIGADYSGSRAFVLENSPEVKMRAERLTHRFSEELGAMGGKSGAQHPWLRGLRETAFITMEMTDRLTTTPIWLAKYEQSQAEGLSHPESVRAADDVIRRVFPPEEMATKSRILRSKGLSPFLLFYGYANKIWNIERVALHDVWRTWHSEEASVGDKAGAVAQVIGRIAAVSLVNGVIGEYFSGRGKTDDEDTGEWMERKLIASVFYPLPFVGALGDWVSGKVVAAAHGKEAPLAKPSIRNAPALAFIQDTVTRLDKAITAWGEGDDAAGEMAIHAAELALGLGVGAPVRQVEKTAKAAGKMATGETTPAGPLDAAGNLIYGESGQANPLSDVQKLISGE